MTLPTPAHHEGDSTVNVNEGSGLPSESLRIDDDKDLLDKEEEKVQPGGGGDDETLVNCKLDTSPIQTNKPSPTDFSTHFVIHRHSSQPLPSGQGEGVSSSDLRNDDDVDMVEVDNSTTPPNSSELPKSNVNGNTGDDVINGSDEKDDISTSGVMCTSPVEDAVPAVDNNSPAPRNDDVDMVEVETPTTPVSVSSEMPGSNVNATAGEDEKDEISTSAVPAVDNKEVSSCNDKDESYMSSPSRPPPLPATAPVLRRSPRFQHPFMKTQISPVIPAKPTPKSFPTAVKMPCSPMDSCYEPISVFCIPEAEPAVQLRGKMNGSILDFQAPPDQGSFQETMIACGQRKLVPLETIFTELRNLKKIGEGVYGEVYTGTFRCLTEFSWVYKLVPIEGDALVNGEVQRKFGEILPEIIVSKKINQLRSGYNKCQTNGYVHMRNARIATGKYPKRLVKSWEKYDEEYESDNDKPEFPESQLYMVLEFEFAGQDIESIIFKDARQSLSIILQVAHILAVGECAFEFEHRDLHWGNVMVESWKPPHISFVIDGQSFLVPSRGIKAVVIDFTMSRLKDKNTIFCLDFQDDDEQFLGTGDHQFDIYRMMRDFNRNDWQKYCPKSNVFWLHYLAHKFSVKRKGNYNDEAKTGEGDDNRAAYHKRAFEVLIDFSHSILGYGSALDFVRSKECDNYKQFLMSVL